MRKFRFVLGLDFGVQSIGWAVLPLNPLEIELLKLGVHCFESGTGSEADIEKGSDESRNTARRMARAARRSLQRRSRRMIHLAIELQRLGLLPVCRMRDPEKRNLMFQELDQRLAVFCPVDDRRMAHLLPYILRAKGLDQRLPEHAIGRALYHLAIRRGFLSNRKAQGADDEEGTVKEGIRTLEEEIKVAGCRTLGEYFSTLDPEETRVRKRWTSRQMHEDEFNLLWDSQAKFYPETMTGAAKKRIHRAIFFQRPLKSQRFRLGKCQLEPNCRRAPTASLEMQRFRYWQKILDLTYSFGESVEEIELTRAQQDLLAETLENTDSLTFKAVAKLLGFKPAQQVKFNLERGGEKSLRGNSTSSRLAKALPDRWPKMSEAEKKTLVDEILQYQSESGLQKRLETAFGFQPGEAAAVAATRLEGDYGNLSRRAISKLLPLMIENEKRIHFKEAEKALYPQSSKVGEVLDFLPPLCAEKGAVLTNPVVTRALTELRKVVNAIIRKYGKPERIVVELARDLKRSRKEREAASKKMRDQETKRSKARTKIIKEVHIQEPTHTDILKVLLAEECDCKCPYTGKTISMESLFGAHPQFDIEHIIPFSRSMDDSYMNKTLCEADENRHVKKNQTPFEAYSHDATRWHEILTRIQTPKFPKAKQERFLMERVPDDFSSRMLNDTRYISRQATTYLGKLYGGQIELPDEEGETGRRRIFTCAGQATAWLRDEWGLNGILNDGGDRKNRNDHRHHAVDALAIAYCNPTIMEQFSRAAQLAENLGISRRFARGKVEPPCANFLKIVRKAVDQINISYRSDRKVSGKLHADTFYSKPYLKVNAQGKLQEYRHKRIPLFKLTEGNIKNIVDSGIQKIIQKCLDAMGNEKFENKVKKFQSESNLPFREVTSKSGEKRRILIKKVRINEANATFSVGHGPTLRNVVSDGNHHAEIVATLDSQGNEVRWTGHVVTLFEAVQRRKQGKPVIQRDHGPGKLFKFSLAINEYLLLTKPGSEPKLYRVTSLEKDGRINVKFHTDASTLTDKTKTNEERKFQRNASRLNINKDLRGNAQKVTVDYLGEIHPAND